MMNASIAASLSKACTVRITRMQSRDNRRRTDSAGKEDPAQEGPVGAVHKAPRLALDAIMASTLQPLDQRLKRQKRRRGNDERRVARAAAVGRQLYAGVVIIELATEDQGACLDRCGFRVDDVVVLLHEFALGRCCSLVLGSRHQVQELADARPAAIEIPCIRGLATCSSCIALSTYSTFLGCPPPAMRIVPISYHSDHDSRESCAHRANTGAR